VTSKFYLFLQLIHIRDVYQCVCPEQGSCGCLRKRFDPYLSNYAASHPLRPPVEHQNSCHLYNYNSFKPPTYIYPGLQCTVLTILFVDGVHCNGVTHCVLDKNFVNMSLNTAALLGRKPPYAGMPRDNLWCSGTS